MILVVSLADSRKICWSVCSLVLGVCNVCRQGTKKQERTLSLSHSHSCLLSVVFLSRKDERTRKDKTATNVRVSVSEGRVMWLMGDG